MKKLLEALKEKKQEEFHFSEEEVEVLALIDHHQWQSVLQKDRCLLEHLHHRLRRYRERELDEMEALLDAIENVPPCRDDEDFI